MQRELLVQIINEAFENIKQLSHQDNLSEIRQAVWHAMDLLNTGAARVCEPQDKQNWVVNDWLKKAILLYFRLSENKIIDDGKTAYFDKVPLKYAQADHAKMTAENVRVVPPATVRFGSYIAPGVVLMPSYVNIGAYIGEGSMIDTWATVGSCAQIGKGVHISGGAGIGGVLEPLQANPTIIGDNCFIGARSEIVEGVVVEKNAVISMGVFIGQSTKIYNRLTGKISYGTVPEGAVVVPGSLPAKDGSHSLSCAVIVKQVDEKARAKVSINDLLRD